MKKSLVYSATCLITSIIIIIATFPISVASANTPACSPIMGMTFVDGNITDLSGSPVEGADVDVTCHHGGGNYETSTVSSSDGGYTVLYPTNECNTGDTVDVTAAKDGMSGANSGVVQDWNGCQIIDINVAVVDVVIPEFGLLTGAFTLISSLGAFFVIKRH